MYSQGTAKKREAVPGSLVKGIHYGELVKKKKKVVLKEMKSQRGDGEVIQGLAAAASHYQEGSEMINSSASQCPFSDSDDTHVGLRTTGLDL